MILSTLLHRMGRLHQPQTAQKHCDLIGQRLWAELKNGESK